MAIDRDGDFDQTLLREHRDDGGTPDRCHIAASPKVAA
jgi:hypothetical protein